MYLDLNPFRSCSGIHAGRWHQDKNDRFTGLVCRV